MLVCQHFLAPPPLTWRVCFTCSVVLYYCQFCKQTFDNSCMTIISCSALIPRTHSTLMHWCLLCLSCCCGADACVNGAVCVGAKKDGTASGICTPFNKGTSSPSSTQVWQTKNEHSHTCPYSGIVSIHCCQNIQHQ